MLDSIIRFSIKNKIIIGMMTLILIIWGLWSATKLPIDAVPDITNNQVQIFTSCPTLAGQEVEQLVTFPIEQSITNIPDIEEIRSISRFGLSVITVVFKESVDIYFARQLINERLSEALENIPAGVGTPEMAPVSTGLGEVYQYIIHPKKGSEDKYTAKDLRTMQDWIVARQLYGTPGIAEVNSFGGELKQYEVAVNSERLRAMGVTIPEVFTALENNNQNTGGAYIDKKPNAYFIRGIGLVTSLEDVENIPVKTNGGVPILIRDVAEVGFGSAVRYGALTFNGEVDAVGGVVMMLKGENSNDVVNRVKEKLPTIQNSLPEDVIIEAYLDRTDLVGRAMKTVESNLIEGALIVIFVLVIFLGNLRAGLIVASAIPLALLFALGMMNVFDVSANLMSLGAIDFGLIVDGAVIVVEATLHHLGLRKSSERLTQAEMDEEVFNSAAKIRTQAAFGEIIILIVYIPILTLVGVEGKMFTPMAQTVAFAIFGALILSLTYIPMMCALFLPKEWDGKQSWSDRMVERLQVAYTPLLQKAIRVKYIIITGTVALFAVSLFLFSRMGAEFIPQLQEGDFAFHCILPQGSSLSQSIETSMQASRIIREFDEVEMVVGKTGAAEVPTDPMPPEATDLMVVLKPQKEWTSGRSYNELGDAIMEKLEVIPGVFFEKNQPIQMRFNELMTGIRQDVAVKIFGEDMDSLATYAQRVSQVIQSVNGSTTPQVEQVSGLPQINIEYHRARMANYGLTVRDVNDIVSTAFAGKSAGVVYENERRFDLVVRLDQANRTSIEDVSNLMIPTAQGAQIPLSQVAQVTYKLGPAQISREEGKRRIVIGFNVAGRDVQSVVREIQEKLSAEVPLPTGYYFTYGGQFENLQKATDRLIIAVPVSLLLIFMLLYFTFHSFKQAALIFTAIPMSAIGGIFALLLRDMSFSISASIGFIALFGVAVLNGIVLIGKFNELEKGGMKDVFERVKEGTKIRLRPVLMTAAVASLGFLPMAISTSAGAEVQKPLATVVIGGLVTATFLTLFVLPLLYIILYTKFTSRRPRKAVVTTLVGILALLSLTINPLQAQERLTIDQALEQAISANLGIQARTLDISAAESLRKTAGELPKANFNFQYGQNEGFELNDGIMISQTIPFPSLFGAKRNAADARIGASKLDRAISINELKKQVRTFYYQIAFYDQNAATLKSLDSIYQDFIKIAELRYRTGDTPKVDISTAETKRGEITVMLVQNDIARKNAMQSLRLLLGNPAGLALSAESEYTPLTLQNSADSNFVATNPAIQAIYQQAKIAEQDQKVERATGLPDFTLGYNNISLIGNLTRNGVEQYYGRGQRFSFVDVGITIPITYGATKARIKSLDFQKQANIAAAEWQEDQLKTEHANTLRAYEQSLYQYRYFRDQALPNAEEIISAAQLSYRTGDITYMEYLFSLQTATDVKLNYLKSIQQVNDAVIQIYYLINK
ncbi:CusA/CzcA family heavy metal efflux RND transporter [Sphingobacterium chungjuense]|uniref:CusA/CzcA family heavy metal efflux RND transporter n=1 Tax=Sphingobacterium chungjuense TaxID=2675553 RepID=UPI001407F554|nr:CusA/CzcA family heavy metal efflux RND transporter [Sphingobacterium chungjuense]